ncbi:MAG: hypothetical protein C0169_02735 [Thermodesulfobacterium geofontis]|uniref:Uncharacterized protein n=1 Tax=Thermodesulfobacterium geofontis TaxID=1295609 RepID=A0A2N7QFC9_9BACT|nr:MAG: hypothetical protein C0169_02735 [Thermodesulfobacterium geofontis]
MRKLSSLEKEFRRFKKTFSKKRELIPVEEQKRVEVNSGNLRMIYLTGLLCIEDLEKRVAVEKIYFFKEKGRRFIYSDRRTSRILSTETLFISTSITAIKPF